MLLREIIVRRDYSFVSVYEVSSIEDDGAALIVQCVESRTVYIDGAAQLSSAQLS